MDAAFDYLIKSADVDMPDVRYDVTLSSSSSSAGGGEVRGIYLREPHESAAARSYSCTVKPTLHEVSVFPALAAA